MIHSRSTSRSYYGDTHTKVMFCSVSTSNCHRQLRVRPRGVEIDSLSVGEPILELLLMSLYGIKIARVYEVQRSSSVPLDDSDDDIQESIWY
jgi:hypothetical protein